MHIVQGVGPGIQPAESLTWGIVPDDREISGKSRLHILPARKQVPQDAGQGPTARSCQMRIRMMGGHNRVPPE